jgi:hypothetical protein
MSGGLHLNSAADGEPRTAAGRALLDIDAKTNPSRVHRYVLREFIGHIEAEAAQPAPGLDVDPNPKIDPCVDALDRVHHLIAGLHWGTTADSISRKQALAVVDAEIARLRGGDRD